MRSKQEWTPSILASSNYLGRIPDSPGSMDTVDWISVHVLARVVLDFVKCQSAGKITCGTEATTADKVNDPNDADVDADVARDGDFRNGAGLVANLALQLVYHVVNPCTATWSNLVPVIQKCLSFTSHPLTVTPFASWVSALRPNMPPQPLLTKWHCGTPALKILDSLDTIQKQAEEGIQSTVLETKKTPCKSTAMRDVGPVRVE